MPIYITFNWNVILFLHMTQISLQGLEIQFPRIKTRRFSFFGRPRLIFYSTPTSDEIKSGMRLTICTYSTRESTTPERRNSDAKGPLISHVRSTWARGATKRETCGNKHGSCPLFSADNRSVCPDDVTGRRERERERESERGRESVTPEIGF